MKRNSDALDDIALPNSLENLAPSAGPFSSLARDVIGGAAFHFRSDQNDESSESYALYSVGWNGSDEGGESRFVSPQSRRLKLDEGDWVFSLKPL